VILGDGQGRGRPQGRSTEDDIVTRDDTDTTEGTVASGGTAGGARPPHRAAFRRKLPFGRAAVLKVGDRAHIVGVADISVTGAFLSTRAPISVGETHILRLLVLPERIEISIQAEVVRLAQSANESEDHPRGVGVRFVNLDDEVRGHLAFYVARKPNLRSA
jgi:Tfp pilus assembly protein PilZ